MKLEFYDAFVQKIWNEKQPVLTLAEFRARAAAMFRLNKHESFRVAKDLQTLGIVKLNKNAGRIELDVFAERHLLLPSTRKLFNQSLLNNPKQFHSNAFQKEAGDLKNGEKTQKTRS